MPEKTPAFEPRHPDFETRIRNSFARQPMMAHVGAEMTEVGPGYCEIVMPWREEITQQHGYVHGGALATIADSAAGYAAFTLMGPEDSPLTVEYKLNILRPGVGERFAARGRVIKPGRTLTVVQSDVFAIDGSGEVMCLTSIQTLMTMSGKADEIRVAPRRP